MLIVIIQQIFLLHFTKSVTFRKVFNIIFRYFLKHCPKIFICWLETFLIKMVLLLKSSYKMFIIKNYLFHHKLFFSMDRIKCHMLIWAFETVALLMDLGSCQGGTWGLAFGIFFSLIREKLRYRLLWHCAQFIKTSRERIFPV